MDSQAGMVAMEARARWEEALKVPVLEVVREATAAEVETAGAVAEVVTHRLLASNGLRKTAIQKFPMDAQQHVLDRRVRQPVLMPPQGLQELSQFMARLAAGAAVGSPAKEADLGCHLGTMAVEIRAHQEVRGQVALPVNVVL